MSGAGDGGSWQVASGPRKNGGLPFVGLNDGLAGLSLDPPQAQAAPNTRPESRQWARLELLGGRKLLLDDLHHVIDDLAAATPPRHPPRNAKDRERFEQLPDKGGHQRIEATLQSRPHLGELTAGEHRPRLGQLDRRLRRPDERNDWALGVWRGIGVCLRSEHGIAGMQYEVPAQELLAIAPAELEIVLAELLVEEAAKRIEGAAGKRGLLAVYLPVTLGRDEIAAVHIGVGCGDQVGCLEPGLVDERRQQRAADEAHAEIAGLGELIE